MTIEKLGKLESSKELVHCLLLVNELVASQASDSARVAPHVDEGSPSEEVRAHFVFKYRVINIHIITDYCESPELGQSVN
jgi:hypothetical protein